MQDFYTFEEIFKFYKNKKCFICDKQLNHYFVFYKNFYLNTKLPDFFHTKSKCLIKFKDNKILLSDHIIIEDNKISSGLVIYSMLSNKYLSFKCKTCHCAYNYMINIDPLTNKLTSILLSNLYINFTYKGCKDMNILGNMVVISISYRESYKNHISMHLSFDDFIKLNKKSLKNYIDSYITFQ